MSDTSLPLALLFAADVGSGRYNGILDHLSGAPSRFALQCVDSAAALLEAAGTGASDICLIGEMEDGRAAIDLLRRLRSTGYSQPVIMLVAAKDDEAGARMLEAGADDYLCEEECGPRLVDRSIRYVLRSALLRARGIRSGPVALDRRKHSGDDLGDLVPSRPIDWTDRIDQRPTGGDARIYP